MEGRFVELKGGFGFHLMKTVPFLTSSSGQLSFVFYRNRIHNVRFDW